MIELSGYNILEKIGSGGMGEIFLAEHKKLEKKVAIKSLHKNLSTNSLFRKRFSQEAKTLSQLDHPNIVRILDYKETKDGLFLIMEYVEGNQFDDYIKNISGPIPEKNLIVYFKQILEAIGYAHDEGFIHRDIKPSNIMIDKKGRIKVLDFGIAKLQDEENGLTKTGIQIGTVSYMSPEQVNAKKLDKLTDIYSLGITLFHMAVGKSPYEAETNTFSIQTKIVSELLPIASNIYPGVSKIIEEIIIKSTQKNKNERYQSCEEFKKNLELTFQKKGHNNKKINKRNIFSVNNKLKYKIMYFIMFLLSFPIIYFIVNSFVGNTPNLNEFLNLYIENNYGFTYNFVGYSFITEIPAVVVALCLHIICTTPLVLYKLFFLKK